MNKEELLLKIDREESILICMQDGAVDPTNTPEQTEADIAAQQKEVDELHRQLGELVSGETARHNLALNVVLQTESIAKEHGIAQLTIGLKHGRGRIKICSDAKNSLRYQICTGGKNYRPSNRQELCDRIKQANAATKAKS